MTDREKKELIEAEETILQLFFDAYEKSNEVHKRQYQPFTPHGSNARVSDGSRPDGKQVLSIFVANGEG